MNNNYKIVYITGISRLCSLSDLESHFRKVGQIISIKYSDRTKAICWIEYSASEEAEKAIITLHHSILYDRVLSVRLEMGVNSEGAHIVDKSQAELGIKRFVLHNQDIACETNKD